MTEPMVAFRSNNNANSNGGVAYVEANYDTSNANDNIGSRLAMIEKESAEVGLPTKKMRQRQGAT